MKIFSALQLQELDKKTIYGGTPQIALIDNAVSAFIRYIIPKISKKQKILCLCGSGNNGIDGLFVALKLHSRGFDVEILIFEWKRIGSSLYSKVKNKIASTGIGFRCITDLSTSISYAAWDVLIDGLIGNGLNRPLEGPLVQIIEDINRSNKIVYAIDIPSGMQADGEIIEPILRCVGALAFELPRASFFYREAAPYLGAWASSPIGIDRRLIELKDTQTYLTDKEYIQRLIVPRASHGYKATYGHTLLIGGAPGMCGAICLSALAAVRAGAGRCTVASDQKNRPICQIRIPEAMYRDYNTLGENIDLDSYTIGIGPGLATTKESRLILQSVLSKISKPMVLDADALNILAHHPKWMDELPKDSIITPHVGEFHRLFGTSRTDYQRKQVQIARSIEHGLYIILKGRYTSISCPDGRYFINSSGNPGMATGGAGDVLTGIITALLAQEYSPLHAAIIGVYIHGISGDIAAKELGQISLSAQSIIDHLSRAFSTVT